MGISAFPYSAVLDVSANSLLGNNTGSPAAAIALTATQVRTLLSVYTSAQVDALLAGKSDVGHTHAASDITSGVIAAARLASSGTADATTYLRGDQTWQPVSAGVGGSTGSVDNAMLRADGAGGATLQASNWIATDNYTASPNNTVNHASLQATGGTTNVSVSIVPKGSGFISTRVPDGTSTNGNARGSGAVDLQNSRTSAAEVASGINSFLTGSQNVASGEGSFACGYSNNASGFSAFSQGQFSTASGRAACALNSGNTSTADYSFTNGYGVVSTRMTQRSFGSGSFSGAGQSQGVEFVLRNKTTDGTTAVVLQLGPVLFSVTERVSIPSGKVLHATVLITGSKSDGSAVAVYMRQVCIKNVGGTTSLVGTVNTLGTDTAAGTSIAITADDTNDALQIAVTGVASETWRWEAIVYGGELAYGT